MGVIPIMLSGFVGAVVALISPIVAVWVGMALWGAASTKHIGVMVAAIGFTSGGLSGALIRLGFVTFTGQQP